MATNHRNEYCVQCQELTIKGNGFRLMHNGSWRTFCAPCTVARQANKNKSVSTAAYINRQPKLFTEEVITMDTNPTTNPEEGIMKTPFKVGDRVKSIKYDYLGTVKWVKFEPNGVMVNRKRRGSHKWDYVQKVEKGGYTVTVNWDVTPICRLHVMQNAKVLELVVSEPQPTNPEEGNKMETKETLFTMTEKQIAYIRDLFKSKKQFMTIDEQESLINKMIGHIDGSDVKSTKWASDAIQKLQSYNTERSAS